MGVKVLDMLPMLKKSLIACWAVVHDDDDEARDKVEIASTGKQEWASWSNSGERESS